MRAKDLRARGETEQRIYMLPAWREVPNLYNARERAALGWAEAVTRLTNQEISDEVYSQAREEFSEKELAQFSMSRSERPPATTSPRSSNLRPRVFSCPLWGHKRIFPIALDMSA